MREEIRKRLVGWAAWCRSNPLPSDFWVGCESIEHLYRPRRGDVGTLEDDAAPIVAKSMWETMQQEAGGVSMDGAQEIADIVAPPFPARFRLVLKLHFVVWYALPKRMKRQILNVSYHGYNALLDQAAYAVERQLRG